jgi:hypothetical protein
VHAGAGTLFAVAAVGNDEQCSDNAALFAAIALAGGDVNTAQLR